MRAGHLRSNIMLRKTITKHQPVVVFEYWLPRTNLIMVSLLQIMTILPTMILGNMEGRIARIGSMSTYIRIGLSTELEILSIFKEFFEVLPQLDISNQTLRKLSFAFLITKVNSSKRSASLLTRIPILKEVFLLLPK